MSSLAGVAGATLGAAAIRGMHAVLLRRARHLHPEASAVTVYHPAMACRSIVETHGFRLAEYGPPPRSAVACRESIVGDPSLSWLSWGMSQLSLQVDEKMTSRAREVVEQVLRWLEQGAPAHHSAVQAALPYLVFVPARSVWFFVGLESEFKDVRALVSPRTEVGLDEGIVSGSVSQFLGAGFFAHHLINSPTQLLLQMCHEAGHQCLFAVENVVRLWGDAGHPPIYSAARGTQRGPQDTLHGLIALERELNASNQMLAMANGATDLGTLDVDLLRQARDHAASQLKKSLRAIRELEATGGGSPFTPAGRELVDGVEAEVLRTRFS